VLRRPVPRLSARPSWLPGLELTVVAGTGLLGRRLLAATPGIVLNVHGGWLPEYRGNHAVHFAYRAGDGERIGATVSIVAPPAMRDRCWPG
jgi:folate-dependent phosphoribosylglycinamide formyltransferase PurN